MEERRLTIGYVNPGTYKHSKGGTYTVLYTSTDTTNATNGRKMVTYVSHKNGELYTRELQEFCEPVPWPDGKLHPRFMRHDLEG